MLAQELGETLRRGTVLGNKAQTRSSQRDLSQNPRRSAYWHVAQKPLRCLWGGKPGRNRVVEPLCEGRGVPPF